MKVGDQVEIFQFYDLISCHQDLERHKVFYKEDTGQPWPDQCTLGSKIVIKDIKTYGDISILTCDFENQEINLTSKEVR